MNWILLAISLVLANLIYQAVGDKQWEKAFDRSYFQAMAILIVYLTHPWR